MSPASNSIRGLLKTRDLYHSIFPQVRPLMSNTMQETPDDGALSFSNFSTSILYPNSLQAESKDMLLQPLSVSVWFSGAVPRHLTHSNIVCPLIFIDKCYLFQLLSSQLKLV
jgi:hypothetical protein